MRELPEDYCQLCPSVGLAATNPVSGPSDCGDRDPLGEIVEQIASVRLKRTLTEASLATDRSGMLPRLVSVVTRNLIIPLWAKYPLLSAGCQ